MSDVRAAEVPGPAIRQLSTRAEIEAAYPVMRQLRPHLSVEEYLAAVERMQAGGFLLAGVTVADQVVAVAGYRFGEGLASGRYCYVDDLVTSDTARSRGYGKLLMDWLKAGARAAGCRTLQLDSGVQRHGAHRFYLRERMDISSYHFSVSLT